MFKSDKPIENSKEDILGRSLFAKNLSKAILSYNEKESLVIGLNGDWGSGKTSAINLTIQEINSLKEKTVIFKFNPWNFSEQSQLIIQFFKQFSIILQKKNYSQELQIIGKKIESYSSLFIPLILIPKVGPIALILNKVISGVGQAAHKLGTSREKDITQQKEEIENLLANQQYKILIVIDDIDRLNDVEIKQIFQLVKLLANFPNTVYLLSFEKEVVIKALDKESEGKGNVYLEKIVQVSFELPLISKPDVEKLLFAELDKFVKELPEKKWDPNHWSFIYNYGIKHLINNVRDVNRYINTLSFNYSLIKNNINIVDFFAITALQVFVPTLYEDIKNNKKLFTDDYSSEMGYSDKKEKRETAIVSLNSIIDRVTEIPKEELKKFLEKLFQSLEALYQNMGYGWNIHGKWRREGRICSEDTFDIYFALNIPQTDFSLSEIEDILSSAKEVENFLIKIIDLIEQNRINRFLERLEDYTNVKDGYIDKEQIKNIIIVLMDTGDLFPYQEEGVFGAYSTNLKIGRIFYQLSKNYEDKNKNFEIIKEAIIKAHHSIYTIVYEVGGQAQQHGGFSAKEITSEEQRTVTSEQLIELKKLACEKIQGWASKGALSKQKFLASILFSWEQFGQPEEVREYLKELILTENGQFDIIRAFCGEIKSYSSEGTKIKWKFNKELSDFINLKDLEKEVRKLNERIPQEEKFYVDIFLKFMEGKQKEFF